MVRFFFADVKNSFTERQRIKKFIPLIFKREKKSMSAMNYIFCSDDYLLDINRKFLKHDYYTDIITFNLAHETEPVIGEIYISLTRVKNNAKQFEVSFKEELLRTLFHGALHLCNYNDKKKQEAKKMRIMEDTYIKAYQSLFKNKLHVKQFQ